MAILMVAVVLVARVWRQAGSVERDEIFEAWKSPVPWLISGLLLAQIVMYQPTMSDSICYRLPRIYLWLQEGRVTRAVTSDFRINAMPWGWEALALPFASLNILSWSRLINLCNWLVVFQITFHWARRGGASLACGRWIAAALASAPGFLLQASSTACDFYAFTLLLICTHIILQHGNSRDPSAIPLSLLALLLACGVKPQFLALGAAWGGWWLLGPHKPWKQFHWGALLLMVPLFVLVSPLPGLYQNIRLTGSLTGLENDPAIVHGSSALMKSFAGCIQFMFTQLQLPIMPFSKALVSNVNRLPVFEMIHSQIPKFKPSLSPVCMIDNASYGLVHSLVFSAGILAVTIRQRWGRWLLLVSIGGLLLATSQVVTGTVGRSSMGFGALVMPVAAFGLARLKSRWIVFACVMALGTGMTAIVTNPSSPLWPSHEAEAEAKCKGWEELRSNLEIYNAYELRGRTGEGILDGIPKGERVGGIFRSVTPLINLWRPDWKAHEIVFVHDYDSYDDVDPGLSWVVVGEKSAEEFPKATALFSSLPDWKPVARQKYLPNIQQGWEEWTLYHRFR